MTHHDAAERSRRLIDVRGNCGCELADLGPDPFEPTLRLWKCTACGIVIAIDPIGVIRDRWPCVD
jgi:hypothetical protein